MEKEKPRRTREQVLIEMLTVLNERAPGTTEPAIRSKNEIINRANITGQSGTKYAQLVVQMGFVEIVSGGKWKISEKGQEYLETAMKSQHYLQKKEISPSVQAS